MIYLILISILIYCYFYYWRSPYKIIKHCDGDTSWVKPLIGRKIKVRYAVIDANESRQAGGDSATQYLMRILPIGSRVSIVPTSKRKSYDRDVIGTVYHNFRNINLAMLKAGYAVIDPRYLADIDCDLQGRYIKAQDRAKVHRLGRWGHPSHYAETPMQFRKRTLSRR
jgi:endonuclease YncB( thermonuclease family)